MALLLVALAGCASTTPEPKPAATPDVQSVLGAVRERFQNADGITAEALVSVGSGGKYFLRSTWVKPGLFREERWNGETPDGEPASVQIYDGKISWLYFPAQKKFYESEIAPEAVDRKPVLLGFTRDGRLAVSLTEPGREEELVFGAGILCMPIAGGGKLALGPEAEVEGKACHVLTYSVGTMVQTFFVSKADATPLRFTLESHSEHQGKKFTTTATSELKRLDPAARPDVAQFRFTPPEGATKAAKAGEDKLLAAGAVAPELGAVDASGKPVKLSDFPGKVILLNFWFLG